MEKNDVIFKKNKSNKHFYISPQKTKFHGFNFLITNIKNLGFNKNKLSINKLLNSSKYMLRNNSNYQLCFDRSRNTHFYPYRPQFSAKNSNFLSSSIETKAIICPKILFKDNSVEESKTILESGKKLITPLSPISNRKKIDLNPKFSLGNIYLNFNFKKIHNEFLKKYKFIENINENDFNFLNDSLKKSLDKKLFLNNEHLEKVSTYNFDSLSIKLKLTGLCFKFYELAKNGKKSILNIKNLKGKKIGQIKFPFEFLSFFYGINFESFLIFLTKVIEYNISKNSFEINYENFFENYNTYKSTFLFNNLDSFIEKYDVRDIKEYFKFNWDVITDNDIIKIKNCLLKILLPKIYISIENNFGKKYIFYANIEVNKLCYFLKNNFLEWDKYILSYFSEFKIFRFSKNNLLSADMNYNKVLKKIRYNLNKTNILLNNIKTNSKSYEFFLTKFTAKNGGNVEKENFFFQIKLPKINVYYRDVYTSLSRQFDLDINTLIKLNKLRKSFNKKDIIKYCLVFIKGKSNLNSNKFIKASTKKNNSYISRNNSGKVLSKFSLKSGQLENIKQFVKGLEHNKKDDVIDIKLNLNENIFNFDEDILKYIKADEGKNDNYKEYYNRDNHSSNNLSDKNIYEDNQKNKLNIEIEKIELNWINNNNQEKKIYKFEENESEYLFDHSSIIWRDYIEKNIDKIISSSLYEKQIIAPSTKNSQSSLRVNKSIKK